MEETLSLPVNMPFDKRAVCTKSGHEPLSGRKWYNSAGRNMPVIFQGTCFLWLHKCAERFVSQRSKSRARPQNSTDTAL